MVELSTPTAHFSHQNGECKACEWWVWVKVTPRPAILPRSSICAVDANVAAFVAVIVVGKQPADLFGQPSRHRDGQLCRRP